MSMAICNNFFVISNLFYPKMIIFNKINRLVFKNRISHIEICKNEIGYLIFEVVRIKLL